MTNNVLVRRQGTFRNIGDVAQLGERLFCTQEAERSIRSISTILAPCW